MNITVIENGETKHYRLPGKIITIGRAPENSIQLASESASRQHCRIEVQADGVVLIDQDSRNGLLVNGRRVKQHRLQPQDEVQIGESILVFEPDQSLRHSPTQEPTAPTHRPSRSPKRRRRRRRVVAATQGLQLTAFSVAFLIVIIILYRSLSYHIRSSHPSQYTYQQLFLQAVALEKAGHITQALAKYHRLVQQAPESPYGQKAAQAIQNLEQAISSQERRARQAFKDLQEQYEVFGLNPYDYCKQLEQLAQLYSHSELAAEVQKELARVRRYIAQRERSLYQQAATKAQELLKQHRFQEALQIWPHLRRKLPRAQWQERLTRAQQETSAQVRQAYEQMLAQGQSLWHQKQLVQAQQLARLACCQFAGTPYAEELRVQLLVPVTQALAQARQVRQDQQLGRIEQYVQKNEYHVARAMAQKLLRAEHDPQLRKRIQEYLQGLDRVLALQAKLHQEINQGVLHNQPYKEKFFLMRATPKYLVLGMQGVARDKAQISLRWSQLSTDDNLQLYQHLLQRLGRVPLKYYLAVAQYCDYHKRSAALQQVLIQARKHNSSYKNAVDHFYAQCLGIPLPRDGFVICGQRLLTRQQQSLFLLNQKIEQLLQQLAKAKTARVQSILEQLQALLTQKVPQTFGKAYALSLRQQVISKLVRQRQRYYRKVQSGMRFRKTATLRHLKQELIKRRQHALELIFDKQAYPYDATHGAKAQPEVDRRVAAVRSIWEDPAQFLWQIPSHITRQIKQVQRFNRYIKYLDPTFQDPDSLQLKYLAAIINHKFNVQNFALNPSEKKRIIYNHQVMEANAHLQGDISPREKEQVKITNLYRIMMGRRALKIDLRLVHAARAHSEYMARSGIFAHVIPQEPNGATPSKRVQKQGFPGMASENIVMGTPQPQAAHHAWIHSSGHHRNILDERWRVMGAGNFGSYWTQNFAE